MTANGILSYRKKRFITNVINDEHFRVNTYFYFLVSSTELFILIAIAFKNGEYEDAILLKILSYLCDGRNVLLGFGLLLVLHIPFS